MNQPETKSPIRDSYIWYYSILSALLHLVGLLFGLLPTNILPSTPRDGSKPTEIRLIEELPKKLPKTLPKVPKATPDLFKLSRPLALAPGPNSPRNAYSNNSLEHNDDSSDGYINLLETDETLHKTFYDRVREKIEPYWRPKVSARHKSLLIGHKGNVKTRVLIDIDSDGVITAVKIGISSGILELDKLAIEAFLESRDFRNPPDGLTKFMWEFIVIF